MIKPLLTLTVALLPVAALADYSAMRFTTANGKDFTVDLTGLSLSASSQGICVQNQTGQELFALGQLTSMQFADGTGQPLPDENQDPDESSISSTATDGQMNVIDLCGVSRGTFSSLTDAVNRLPKGVYVGRGVNGLTIKFSITK